MFSYIYCEYTVNFLVAEIITNEYRRYLSLGCFLHGRFGFLRFNFILVENKPICNNLFSTGLIIVSVAEITLLNFH